MPNIVETAVKAGMFSKLVAACQAAGLDQALSGTGPFTVFAPNDDAFGKLPSGTLEALLKDKVKLTSILKYHVVSGRHTASDLSKLTEVETLQGQSIGINATGGKVRVDNAQVVKADIDTQNGVIHVIDTVIMPK
jgi:uncharacterized surface protein with fasciclin (FAS1) repeats